MSSARVKFAIVAPLAAILLGGCGTGSVSSQSVPKTVAEDLPSGNKSSQGQEQLAAALADYERSLRELTEAYAAIGDEKEIERLAEKERLADRIAVTKAMITSVKSRLSESK